MIKAVIFDFNRTIYNPDKKELFGEALSVLQDLSKNYKLGLISYGDKERQRLIMNLGITRYFEHIQTTTQKTAKDFKKMVESLDCDAKEILVVGDRIEREIKIANNLGMTSVWLKKGKFASETPQTRQEEPNFIIASLLDIKPILLIINSSK